MKLKKYIRAIKNHRGDTIVEVMLSMSILAIILAVAYATSSRSLQSGLNSQYRGQALSYAQAQLELIKNADNSSSSTGSYKVSNPFCIDPSNNQRTDVTTSCALPIGASQANQNQFTVADTYNSASQTFKVTVSWTSADNQPHQTVLYYKAHNSFTNTPGSFDPPTSSVTTPPPQVGLTFSANCGDGTTCNVAYNSNVVLSWAATNAQICTASGDWSGSKNATGGTETQGFLRASKTYTLTCSLSNGASQISKSVVINVAPQQQTSLTFTATPSTIATNSSSTLSWTSDGTLCNATGAWSGIKQPTGSQSTGSLSSTQTYTLTCASPLTAPTTKSVTVTVANPAVITAFGTWSDSNIYTNQGAPRYLFWNTTNAVNCNVSNNYNSNFNVSPNSYVYVNVYPPTYTLTCYNSAGMPTTANFTFSYHHSYFIAYQHARFDGAWPGWTWGPVGEGYYGLPGDMSSFQSYGRVAVRDNYGHCASFQNVDYWQLYGWVQDYGLVNDAFGTVDVGHDCGGN